jgi:Glycosyl hydrolase family 79 C-terminal beta domain
LSSGSAQGLADSVAAAVRASHARHIPLRIDEMNTIGCGTDRVVGESFASALWALDAVFDMARVGVDGVNVSSFPGATYELFKFSHADGRWQALVEPEYYGLLMFAQAAPAGSRLLRVTQTHDGELQAFASRAPDGTTRLVVINEGSTATRAITVRALAGARASGTGTLKLLTASSLTARNNVTLGGQSFGATTTTGLLAGVQKTDAIPRSHGEYTLRVPPASAALLTIS